MALGEKQDCGQLHNPAPHNSGAWELGPGEDIGITTLDNYELQDIDLLKIDVQGYELKVLQGAKETLRGNKPVVIVEVVANGKLDPRPGQFLTVLGATLVQRTSKDAIYVWP